MSTHRIIVGTRGSALALWQTRHVVERLQAVSPDLDVHVEIIQTQGDLVRDRALSEVGGKGLFVKEIENALMAGEIDLAVHSLKDMPTEQPGGLALGAILERADPHDALIVRDGPDGLDSLPHGAHVGTSSLRRRAQLLAARPDLQILDLRGNVDTRLRKLIEGQYDAVVLAAAGLIRLGHALSPRQLLPLDLMLPAVGQGALCIEVRTEDEITQELIAPLEHLPTRRAAEAERAFLRRLEGGCQVPIGALAQVEGDRISLSGLIASPDGARLVRDQVQGSASDAVPLGVALAERLLAAGGHEILQEVRRDR
jgi:hydroxymethylbilane synthase